jgi:hypothetical protein
VLLAAALRARKESPMLRCEKQPALHHTAQRRAFQGPCPRASTSRQPCFLPDRVDPTSRKGQALLQKQASQPSCRPGPPLLQLSSKGVHFRGYQLAVPQGSDPLLGQWGPRSAPKTITKRGDLFDPKSRGPLDPPKQCHKLRISI